MHILIADDDPVYRNLLENLLRQWDFEVTSTSDGNEAWQAIQRDDTVKLAILDWMMPGMDGYEVCQKIGQGIYTILITGTSLKGDIIKVLIAGADDYIIKPFEPLDLKIRLRVAMRIIDLEAKVAELRKSLPQQSAADTLPDPEHHQYSLTRSEQQPGND